MKKYGLQLRIPQQQRRQQQQQQQKRPVALGFGGADDDDDDDVEKEIARQAAKNRALKEVEDKHKKALEEDPSVFDYDGVYDEMKLKVAKPIMQDQKERKPKYIEKLLEKAKERKMEQDIIYERNLLKERTKEDHLYANKPKFVTSSYKKKLEEQEKWKEEERLRQIREEKEDVTKATVTDFYLNLEKNVAFGATKVHEGKLKQQEKTEVASEVEHASKVEHSPKERGSAASTVGVVRNVEHSAPSAHLEETEKPHDSVPSGAAAASTSEGEKTAAEQLQVKQISEESYRRDQDVVAAAKERYLARKRTREQQIL